ncbi:MAG: nitrogenase molybdenum-iron protein subunit beta [Chitinispirillaceae bacterium]
MLLRHTNSTIKERKALVVNPAKTCQPIGAMYAALGLHGCLPHSHGSQGCCAYHRSTLTRHYKEPVMAATSSFTEGAAVFGGQSNLLEAITNIFAIYDPRVLAIHTTCLSETIGDDVNQIVGKAKEDGRIPEGKHVIYASTPSYAGSHVTGFSSMVKAMVTAFSESTGRQTRTINIIPGWVEPSDMREIKSLASQLGINIIMFPDTSDILDAPQTGNHTMYPKGGATPQDIRRAGDSKQTIALGPTASGAAARALDAKCKVPCEIIDLPVGLLATDRFIDLLRKSVGVSVPDSLSDQRGRVVDIITDMNQYFYNKRVAMFGDPDQLISLGEFLVTLGMKPVYVVSGTPGKKFDKRMREALGPAAEDAKIASSADTYLMHQWIKNEPVDLIIGNTYGKYIARDENIPFVRYGFPILDRVGHIYFPTVGYAGAMRIAERILDALLDKKDRESPEEAFELVM